MEIPVDALTLKPIGIFKGPRKHPYEAPRQPADHDADEGEIILNEGQNFEQALQGLEGCDRIWVIFQFHHNTNWKPMVRPPRGSKEKIGVFATRAPYRPNPLGLSCVRLTKIEGRKLQVENTDLLDGTPIFDIKPYVAEADAFPEAKLPWLQTVETEKWTVTESENAENQLNWLEKNGVAQLRGFATRQLEYDPFDADKKRLTEQNGNWTLAYRTWRVDFEEKEKTIKITGVRSAYTPEELADAKDPYADKSIHRDFKKKFL